MHIDWDEFFDLVDSILSEDEGDEEIEFPSFDDINGGFYW
jgi:hypothetical protein